MPKMNAVETVLSAFLGLFTQAFRQDLRASLAAAATSVCLAAALQSVALFGNFGTDTAEFAGTSLILILVWMAATAIFTEAHRVALSIARNLSVIAFWIAVTLVLTLAVTKVFPEDDPGRRLIVVSVLLVLTIPVHLFRNLPFTSALRMTVAVLASTTILVWRIV